MKKTLPKAQSTSRDLFKSLSLNLISNLLLYAGHLIIARSMLREDYATFTVVISFVSLAAFFVDLGATALFIRKFATAEALVTSGGKDERGVLLGSILGFRIGLAVIVSIAVIIITPNLGYTADTRHLMMVMLLIFFISSRVTVVRTVGEAFLRGRNKYHVVAFFAAIDALVFAGILFFYSGKILNLEKAVWIYTLCNLPGFLLIFGFIYRNGKSVVVHLRFSFTIIRSLLREGLPLIYSTIFLSVYSYADPLLLDKLSTPIQVSAFGAGMRVLSAMVFLPLVFSAIIAPLVTQAIVKEEFARIRSLTDRSFRLLIIFAVLIALIISSAPDTIIHVLFGGDKYQDAAPIVILFGWMFIPLCFGIFMAEIAVAEGILWLPAVYFGTAMIFSITLDIILIPKYGALGSAIAKTIGTTCGAATLFLFSKKLVVVEWKFFLNFILKLFLILLIVIPVRYLFISLQLNEILIVCFVCACFMVLVLLLKAIQLREAVSFVNSISGRNRKL